MNTAQKQLHKTTPSISIEIADQLSHADLDDLCDAAEAAIATDGGFGWVSPPPRDTLERYWKGVLVVPERHLILARLDGAVCGATQLVEPSRHNEAQAHSASLLATFIAPHARRSGAGSRLISTAEKLASEMGYKTLQLDVRETQDAAIRLFESSGFRRWGVNPAYAVVHGKPVAGHYYSKAILSVVPGNDA